MVFTTRKLESSLPSLKSAVSIDLKSRVVYKLSCKGCTSTYVGQIVRHMTTRIEEHKKADSPVGLHLQQCQLEGNSADLSWEIIDRSNNQTKLLTVPVGNIWKFDLEEYEIRSFGMKFNFSKIRIEPVMLNFLATTENIRNKRRTTKSQLRESGRKNSGKLLFAISEILVKNTRVELSYLDIGDRVITKEHRNSAEPE